MEVNGVSAIYGFQFEGAKCIEGDKYIICGTRLFYKGTKEDLAEKTNFCRELHLKIYVREDTTYVGFKLTRHHTLGGTALHLFHRRMKNLEKQNLQIHEFLQDIIVDCHLNVDEIRILSIPHSISSNV